MKSLTLSRDGNAGVILFFTGWAMDSRPFMKLCVPGFDIILIWDYSDPTFPDWNLEKYEEIGVVGWSYGVPYAARFLSAIVLPNITATIAINGTLSPVSDDKGIPRRIFQGTVDNLSPANLRKFYRRMFSRKEDFDAFEATAPDREIGELRRELEEIGSQDFPQDAISLYDTVVISSDDRVIPSKKQLNGWSGHPDIRVMDDGHVVDFQRLLPSFFRDNRVISRGFLSAADSYDAEAGVQRHIAERAFAILKDVMDTPPRRVFEAGVGSGFFTDMYMELWHPSDTLWYDIAPARPGVKGRDASLAIRNVKENSLDLVAGTSCLQWFHSPAKFIIDSIRKLRPGGILLLTSFADGHFQEFTPFIQSPLRYFSEAWFSAVLPDDAEVLHLSTERHTVEFDSVSHLLKHLSMTGVNGLSPTDRIATTRNILANYPRELNGKYTLTYMPIYLIVRKKS